MKKKHQHFIPKTYLKKFSHTQKKDAFFVDVYDKTTGKFINNMSVTNICVETDLYTLKNLEGDKKYKIEDFFSEKIESKYPSVYKILVLDKKKIITPEEKRLILYTTLSMYLRTPKALNKFVEFTSKLLQITQKNSENKTIDFLGYSISIEGKSFNDIKREIKETNRVNYIKTQLALLDEIVEFKFFDGITVIELVGNQEFITSDNPVEIRNTFDLDFHLFDPKNSTYIPLDPKHALFIAPKDNDTIINEIFYQKDNFVMHTTLNHSVYDNAERWIIGTKKGIKQFFDGFEENTKFIDKPHPTVLKFQEKLKLMNDILNLSRNGISNDNQELIKSLKNLKKHEFFINHVDLQEMYEKFKDSGLNI